MVPRGGGLEDRCGDHVLTFVDDGTKGERYVLDPATVGDDQLGQADWPAGLVGKVLGWLP